MISQAFTNGNELTNAPDKRLYQESGNDTAFASGQSQLAFVVGGTAIGGTTLRIVGYDYNEEAISEDITIADATSSQARVYHTCNSYYERDETSSGAGNELHTKVYQVGTAGTGTVRVYAISDRFEVTFNNAQDVNEGMTLEQKIGNVPTSWGGMYFQTANLQFGDLIRINGTMLGRRGYHRRAVHHLVADNIGTANNKEWNGEEGVSLQDSQELLPNHGWRPPAQDIFVDWGCELRITPPAKGGTSTPIILPTTQLSFSINQNLEPRVRSDGTRMNQKPTRGDRRMIDMQCTVDYTEITGEDDKNDYPDWNKHFLADDLFEAEIRLYQRAWPGAEIQEDYVVIFDFGQLQLTVNPVPPVNTFGPILQQLAFKALPSKPQLTDEITITSTTPRWQQLDVAAAVIALPLEPTSGTETITFSIAADDSTESITALFTDISSPGGITYKVKGTALPTGVTFDGTLGQFVFDASEASAATPSITGIQVTATNAAGESAPKAVTIDINA